MFKHIKYLGVYKETGYVTHLGGTVMSREDILLRKSEVEYYMQVTALHGDAEAFADYEAELTELEAALEAL